MVSRVEVGRCIVEGFKVGSGSLKRWKRSEVITASDRDSVAFVSDPSFMRVFIADLQDQQSLLPFIRPITHAERYTAVSTLMSV